MKKYSFADMQMLHWKDYEFRVSAADLSERQTNPFDGHSEQAGTDAVHTVYRSTSSRTAHGRFYFPGARRRGHGCNFAGMVGAVAGGLR